MTIDIMNLGCTKMKESFVSMEKFAVTAAKVSEGIELQAGHVPVHGYEHAVWPSIPFSSLHLATPIRFACTMDCCGGLSFSCLFSCKTY